MTSVLRVSEMLKARLALLYVLYLPGFKGSGLRALVKFAAAAVALTVVLPWLSGGAGGVVAAGAAAYLVCIVSLASFLRRALHEELLAVVKIREVEATSCGSCGDESPTAHFFVSCCAIKSPLIYASWAVLAVSCLLIWRFL